MGVVRYNGIGMVTEDEFNTGLAGKLDKPDVEGTTGQVLTKTSGGGEEWATIPSTGTPADDTMNDSSTNAVQNKVVKAYVDNGDAALDAQKANKDGYYEQLVSGAAKNLEAPITVSDAFLARPTGGEGAEVADGVAQILEAEGNSVKFNQLVPNGTTYSGWNSRGTASAADGRLTVSGAGESNQVGALTGSVAIANGHKFYASVYCEFSDVTSFGIYVGYSNWNKTQTVKTVSSSPASIISGIFTANADYGAIKYIADGTSSNKSLTIGSPILLDLTAMGIDSLTTVEEVEAWLAKNIGAMAYYPYTTGTVLNNCMEGIEAPGYNLLDPATGKAQIIGAYSDLYGNYYGIVGTHGALTFTDAYGNSSTITPDSDGKFELTVPGELSVASAGADCAVFLWWDGTKKEYEPYELNHGYLDVKHIYGKLNGEGDLVQVYAAGMASVGDYKDYLHNVDGSAVADKVIGSRAYTSGDESDSTVITDGTTTYYHLTTELRYTNLVYQGSSYYADGTPVVLPVNYKVSNWSIESILPKNTSSALVTAPAALTCKYSLGAVDLLNTHTDEIADLYDKKADKDGTYPELISGNLIDGNGVGTDQEIVFRPTGGGAALAGNSNAIIQTIKGRTLVWNQLVSFTDKTTTVNDVAVTVVSNKVKILGTAVGGGGRTVAISNGNITIKNGHKYVCITGLVVEGSGAGLFITSSRNSATYIQLSTSDIVTYSGTTFTDGVFGCNFINGASYDTEGYISVIDLTDLFGAGNEPTTVAEFEALYPNPYYAYNAGTLLPFKGAGIKTTGVNQWDEQWETGQIDPTTGEPVTSGSGATSGIRPTNFIPVIPGNDYCFYSATVRVSYLFLYDNDKNFIQAVVNSSQQVFVYTIPQGVAYIKFHTPAAYGSTYLNDICINISNPALNGTYKPYTETLVNIDAIGKSAKDGDGNAIVPFPTGVNGVGTVYDQYDGNGGTKRFGVVDLGSLGWSYVTTSGHLYFESTTMPSAMPKIIQNADALYNLICSKYESNTWRRIYGNVADKLIGIYHNDGKFVVYDSEYTDAATFKAAMAGVKLVYELDTPVPFTWDTPLDLIYPAPAGGTEMLLPQGVDESGVPATTPMDATIFYSKDYVQTINDMPKDFDTTASIDALATALATTLSTALDGTFTITRGAYDSTNKKYSWTVSFTSNAEEE